MKLLKKVMAITAIFGLTATLFAGAPESFKKTATAGLIEDGLVDEFDVGVDDAKGLWFGGYNSYGAFNFGYGTYVGKIWLSVFDSLSDSTFSLTKGSEKTIDEIADDGVNVDKTKTTSKDYEKTNSTGVDNNLYLALAVDKVGAQLFWYTSDWTPAKDNYTETKEGVIKTQEKKNVGRWDEVGAFFNGIGVKDIGNAAFYIDLKKVSLGMSTSSSSTVVTTVADPNADPEEDPATTQVNSNATAKSATYTPAVDFEFGLKLPAVGKSENKLSFYESFTYAIPGKTFSKSTTETVDTSNKNQTVTTIVSKDEANNTKGTWSNTITPKLTTKYDVGENLVFKTVLAAPVSVSNGISGLNSPKTTVTETITTDNVNAKTTKTRTEVSDYNDTFNNYLTTTLTTSVTPKISMGLSYALKPNKCYLNLGAVWQAGTCSWTYTTKKMQTGTKTTKKINTDEFGQETVVQDDVTIYSADTSAEDATPARESAEFKFTSADPSDDKLYVGTTWMLNENASIDILYSAGVTSFSLLGTNGMFTSSLSAQFTVKF